MAVFSLMTGRYQAWTTSGKLLAMCRRDFLADDTIAANIAFGLALDEIDHQRVEEYLAGPDP